MKTIFIASLLLLAVCSFGQELDESGKFGDFIKKAGKAALPVLKDIGREVAPVLKNALKQKLQSEIDKRLKLEEEVEESSIEEDAEESTILPMPDYPMYKRPGYPTGDWKDYRDRVRPLPFWNKTRDWTRDWINKVNKTRKYYTDVYRPRFDEEETEESQWGERVPREREPRRENPRDTRPTRPPKRDWMRPLPFWNRTKNWTRDWINKRNKTRKYYPMPMPPVYRPDVQLEEETEESQWGERPMPRERDYPRRDPRDRDYPRDRQWRDRVRPLPFWNRTKNWTRDWINKRNKTRKYYPMPMPPVYRPDVQLEEEVEESQWNMPQPYPLPDFPRRDTRPRDWMRPLPSWNKTKNWTRDWINRYNKTRPYPRPYPRDRYPSDRLPRDRYPRDDVWRPRKNNSRPRRNNTKPMNPRIRYPTWNFTFPNMPMPPMI